MKKFISNSLKNYIVDAILLIVLGLVLIFWPHVALVTIFTWIGIGLIVLGVIKGIAFFMKKNKKDRRAIDLIVGIIQIIVGILFIAKSDFLIAFFPIAGAILLAYGAIIMIIHAIKMKDGNQNSFLLSLVLGIVTLVLAAIIFVNPVLLANVMVQATGVSMIVEGVSLLLVLSRKTA